MSLMTFLNSNVSWYIMWVQTVEVFSTDVRGGAASFVGLVSSIAGLSVPYLTMLVLTLRSEGFVFYKDHHL